MMTSLFNSKMWYRWLNRRLPPQRSITLHRGNVFIFPTLFGGSYIVVCIVLFVMGTNYQNNLVIMLSTLLLSIFTTTMLKCYQNLAGMELQARIRGEFFARQPMTVHCQVTSTTPRYGCEFNFKNQMVKNVATFNEQLLVALTIKPQHRGIHRLDRLTVASVYPLGLFRAWSHLDLDRAMTVYPEPISCSASLTATNDSVGGGVSHYHQAGDSFSHLKEYQRGESLKRVAWKQVAQGRGMLTKCFEQEVGEPQWLDLAQIKGDSLEQRLSYLSHLVIELSTLNKPFGLNLSGHKLTVNHGNSHRKAALTRLASYGENDE